MLVILWKKCLIRYECDKSESVSGLLAGHTSTRLETVSPVMVGRPTGGAIPEQSVAIRSGRVDPSAPQIRRRVVIVDTPVARRYDTSCMSVFSPQGGNQTRLQQLAMRLSCYAYRNVLERNAFSGGEKSRNNL